jgi:hypothetical protein
MATEVLNPYYVAGFVDGEGCFSLCISANPKYKTGYEVRLLFDIELREDDREILERIQATLQCGHIYHLTYERYGWTPHVKYKVSCFTDIYEKVIPFFQKYPLQAKKNRDFALFCEAAELVKRKQHLTRAGLAELGKLKARMNVYEHPGGNR